CDGKDNDCNGITDDFAGTWYRDNDGDGYGSANPVKACTQPAGYAPLGGDCDDTSHAIHPNAPEVCTGVDDTCNVLTDEGVTVAVWKDMDGDGCGAPGTPQKKCQAGPNEATNALDCDDTRANVNPAAGEICDGLDNN